MPGHASDRAGRPAAPPPRHLRRLVAPAWLLAVALVLAAGPSRAQRVLFDARHGQTAGNADWIVDADSSQQIWSDYRCARLGHHHSAQRFPTPPQATIGPDTPETVWSGGISAWAVDLVQDALDPARGRDWTIEQYPWDAPELTFGDPMNPQDLASYDVLVLCEPNVLFTDGEAQAIREFVASGGGLFLCADHETSDRNCSGGGAELHDSPFILNRLMRTDVETRRTPPYFDPASPGNDFGVFGIWFHENDDDDPDDAANKAFDWYDEPVDDNVSEDPDDPIVHGPFGDGSGGLGLFGATQIALSTDPERGNPTARGHVWRKGRGQEPDAFGVTDGVTFATATYGAGRVVAVVDSSPADDGTGEGALHPGWDKASGGVANDVLFLNATEWLAHTAPDTTAPVLTGGPTATATDCSAAVAWVTDEPASSMVAWGDGPELDRRASAQGLATGHRVALSGLTPETTYRFRVASSDAAGNGPTESAVGGFTTGEARELALSEVEASAHSATSGQVAWRTGKPAAGVVRLTAPGGPAREVSTPESAMEQRVALDGLAPDTAYRVAVEVTDACGAHAAAEAAFTTPEAPAEIDLSGWRLVNDNPQIRFAFPAGTHLTAGAYLVIGRDGDRTAFESEWGALDPAVVYVDSGDSIVVNGTPRTYTLLDAAGNRVDGPTVTMVKGRSKARTELCAEAGLPAAWLDRGRSQADPGTGAAGACGAGVRITEVSDAGDYRHEFVELRFDPPTTPSPPPIPPAEPLP